MIGELVYAVIVPSGALHSSRSPDVAARSFFRCICSSL